MSETFGVRGRVLAEDGEPRAGARVILGPELRCVATDAEGRFAFDGLARGNHHWIRAHGGDYYSTIVNVKTEENVELRMCRRTTLVATVLADGQRLAGAIVALSRVFRTVTDDRGIATLRGLPPESFAGRVAAAGRATHDLNVAIVERVDLVEEIIELVPGAEISGRVIDQSGAPVRNARVMVTGESQRPR